MKKAVRYRYGTPEVIEFLDVQVPEAKEDEVLIKIKAFSVTSGDVRMRLGSKNSLPLWPISKLAIGMFKPRNPNLGFDFAGEVVAIGAQVVKYKVGDRVFGLTGQGTNMEYRAISEQGLFTHMPDNLSFEEATSLPFGALTVMDFFGKADVKHAQSILINGASGAVGSLAVQIAKHYGLEVTAICSKKNHQLMSELGADRFIDYHDESIYQGNYDIIMDTLGKMDFSKSKKHLNHNGKFIILVMGFKDILHMAFTSIFGHKKAIAGVAKDTNEYLSQVKSLAEQGVIKPIIDNVYEFEFLRDAHSRVETGHKVGNVIVKFK